ncbi:MAG: hypothetical protein JXR37_22390 [Kiritimatiellae bacterium]|nr:hypothetical protein [Kiritimatiellia bacterium]
MNRRVQILLFVFSAAVPACAGLFDGKSAAAGPRFSVDGMTGTVRGRMAGYVCSVNPKPDYLVVVRVECAGFTRHHVWDPADPWREMYVGRGGNFFLVPGTHTAKFVFFRPDPTDRRRMSKELRAETREFRVVPIGDEEALAQALERVARNLCANQRKTRARRAEFADAVRRARSADKTAAGRLDAYMFNYIRSRTTEFRDRLKAYAELAHTFEMQGRPEDALAALDFARQIYEAEKDVTFSGPDFQNWPIRHTPDTVDWPPPYLDGYVQFYQRRGDLAKAVEWLEKQPPFLYDQLKSAHRDAEQKKQCRDRAARIYRDIANVHVSLAFDWEAYDRWMRKAGELKPE